MKISVICVGKVKEKFYRDAIAEYSKRLSRYIKLEVIEVADEKTKEQCTENEINIVKDIEGERIINAIKDSNAYLVCRAINGKKLDSVELSKKIEHLGIQGTSHIYFVIGGSLGLSDNVLKKADYLLSFSNMTFPHQLMRVILLEQVYRSYRIMNNEPYHK